jgi:tape measure domain-containing protein
MAAPELRLNVSLDLGFFRQQLQKLTVVAQSEFAPQIKVKFDRKTLANEYRLLNRYIGGKTFNVTIATNLEAEIKAADRLVKAIGRVQQAASSTKSQLPLGSVGLSKTKGQGGFTAAEVKTLFSAAIKGGLLDEKTLGRTREQMVTGLSSIAKDAMAGLLNGLSSSDTAIRKAAESIGTTLISTTKTVLGIASPSRVFKGIGENVGKGFEIGAVASMDRAFDELERKIKERLSKLQSMLQREPSRRGAFPFIAAGGRMESAPIAREIDQAYAQLARIQERRQGRLSSERGALAQSAGRLLPASASSVPTVSGQDIVLRNFLTSVRNTNKTLRENFSANSYLPRATKVLAASMEQAGANVKAITGARGPIAALPSAQMLEQRRFQSAAEKAAQIDAANAAREQARKASEQASLRAMFQGVPAISAPSIGQQNAPLSRAASYMLSKANRMLGLPIGPSSPIGSMGQFPMSGMIGRGSMGQFPVDPMLAVGGASAMGQKVAGPYPWSNTTRSAQGGYIPSIRSSAFFPMSGMMGPSSPLGRVTPQSSMFGGGGAPPVPPRGGGGRGGFLGGGQFNVPNLPGAGVVREIGTEFAFAAKQVLLFGTAYKALAFIQGFPSEVGNAVGALQSFRNTLGAISPSAEEAAASSQFILDVVDKYNTPIQSARDGFTKLYASMKPTGFSGDEIRDLFLGISQAAATFGMSADEVDRVNYAFAQMASKGQVMSEELKGQLGDVLPGAMGIFAEAAGFEGPDAITKFSEALEDGAYKGEAMKTLLTNVGSIMRKEFGPGAEGAARTFQGVINRMQNSFKLLYESFEPVAVGFLNSVVVPMTSGIKTLTDGFNAFFAGTTAKTSGGLAIAQELEKLRPTFEGLRANAAGLIQVFGEFAKITLSVGQLLLQIAGNPIVGYLAKIYAIVVPLNMALGVMRSLWALNALQLLIFNARVATGTGTLTAFRGMMRATGATAAVTATSIRTAGITLRTFFATTGVGLVLVGVSMLIERFMSMNQALADTRAKALGAAQAIRAMSQTEARQAANQAALDVKLIQGVSQRQQVGGQPGRIAVSEQEKAALERAGISTQTTATRERGLQGFKQTVGITQLRGAIESRQGIRREAESRQRQIKFDEQQSQQPVDISPITPSGEDDKGKSAKAAKERESQIPQLTLALEKTKELSGIEMQIVNAQLMNNTTQLSSLELLKQLVEFKYEAKALALEDLTTEERALKYKEIGLRREQAIFENQLQLQIDLKKERDGIQEGFAATLAGYQEEANFQQMYLDLINQGLLPSLAKARVEAEKAFAEGEKKLDQSIEQIEANVASLNLTIEALKLEENLTPEKQKQLEADEKRLEILKEDLRLRGLLKDTAPERRGAAIEAAERGLTPKTAQEYIGEGLEAAQDRLKELADTGYQVVEAANAIGNAFGEAFKGLVTGSMTAREALAGMFQSIADHFADMVAQMIAEWLKAQLIRGFMSLFPGFGGGGLGSSESNLAQYAPLQPFANGGIAAGGFQAFANGGIVTGPTLGLVGEGRYNEAVIPLPDGKSVPVDLGGAAGNQINSNITVNVNNGQAQSNATGSNSSELGRKIEGAVKQVIVGELRPGGLLAR